MDIVFARTTAIAGHVTINEGSHWPANDPIVQAYPSLFTASPRTGLSFSRTPDPDEEPAPPAPPAPAAEQTDSTAASTAGAEEREEPPPVEQATKAPGEKRTTRRAR